MEKLYILFLILWAISNHVAAQSCHKLNSRLNPGTQFLCNGFVDLLRLNNLHAENIDELSFSKNDITAIDASSFNKKLNTIERIYLDNNDIMHISAHAFKNLPNLKEIDLSHNKLEVLDLETFTSNIYLTTIDLTGNKIKILDVNLIKKLDNLKKLILSNNSLEVCNSKTAEALRYLEKKEIETLFLQSCEKPELITEGKLIETINVASSVVNKTSTDDERSSTIGNILPLFGILSVMLLLSVALGIAIATLCLKISKKPESPSNGRTRTRSGNYLLSRNSQRCSTSSEEDEDGYMRPRVILNSPQYLEVIEDTSQESLNSTDDFQGSRTLKLTQIPVPHVPTPVLYGQQSVYQHNHVYEEIQARNLYATNLQNHLLQPYSYVKK